MIFSVNGFPQKRLVAWGENGAFRERASRCQRPLAISHCGRSFSFLIYTRSGGGVAEIHDLFTPRYQIMPHSPLHFEEYCLSGIVLLTRLGRVLGDHSPRSYPTATSDVTEIEIAKLGPCRCKRRCGRSPTAATSGGASKTRRHRDHLLT